MSEKTKSVFTDPENVPQPEGRCRPGIVFGHGRESVRLSVQAGEYLYCDPREDGLELTSYRKVEVALIRLRDGAWLRPSDFIRQTPERSLSATDTLIGIGGEYGSDADYGFSQYDDVAAYVDVAIVSGLEVALRDWEARNGTTALSPHSRRSVNEKRRSARRWEERKAREAEEAQIAQSLAEAERAELRERFAPILRAD